MLTALKLDRKGITEKEKRKKRSDPLRAPAPK
jgi:hypothetical protein